MYIFAGNGEADGNTAVGTNTAISRVFGGAVGADYLFSPKYHCRLALAGG
jgi:hypothetical protein